MSEKYPDLFEASKKGYSDAHSEGLRARFCAEGTLKQIIGVNAEWHLQSLSTLKIKQKHIVSGLWHMWILSLFLSRRVHSRPQVAQQVLADDSSPASPRRQRDLRSFCFFQEQIREKDGFNVSIWHVGVGAAGTVGTMNEARWPDGE